MLGFGKRIIIVTELEKSEVKAVIKLLQRADVYRLIKKSGLNNFSKSSIQGVMNRIKVKGFEAAFMTP